MSNLANKELTNQEFRNIHHLLLDLVHHRFPRVSNHLGQVAQLAQRSKQALEKELIESLYKDYLDEETGKVKEFNTRNIELFDALQFKERIDRIFDEIDRVFDRDIVTIKEEEQNGILSSKEAERRQNEVNQSRVFEKTHVLASHILEFMERSGLLRNLVHAAERLSSRTNPQLSFLLNESTFFFMASGKSVLIDNLALELELEHNMERRAEALEKRYYSLLTKEVLRQNGVVVDPEEKFEPLFLKVFNERVSLKKPEDQVLVLYREFTKQGGKQTLDLVKEYLQHINAPTENRELLAESMLKFLNQLNLQNSVLGAMNGQSPLLDEFFGPAYIYAAGELSSEKDPIKNVFSSNGLGKWNFQVDYFEQLEEQGIDTENILAAGALDYIYELGDRLGVFRMTDMLVLMWAQGRLDLSQQSRASDLLYRYYKLREDRMSPEERAMVYKQVLNKGNANLLSRMMPNEDFTMLWQQLMSESVDYIQKSERHQDFNNLVSKSGIFQATRNLQYNLTANMVGKPLRDVHEMYAQLQQCIAILSEPDITARLAGGSHNNMWGVIEKLSREEFGVAPNIAASRTAAVEGNKIFKWIGNFQKNLPVSRNGLGGIDEETFQRFLQSAEAYILAQGQLDEGNGMQSPGLQSPPATDDFEEAVEVAVDEFDDFD